MPFALFSGRLGHRARADTDVRVGDCFQIAAEPAQALRPALLAGPRSTAVIPIDRCTRARSPASAIPACLRGHRHPPALAPGSQVQRDQRRRRPVGQRDQRPAADGGPRVRRRRLHQPPHGPQRPQPLVGGGGRDSASGGRLRRRGRGCRASDLTPAPAGRQRPPDPWTAHPPSDAITVTGERGAPVAAILVYSR